MKSIRLILVLHFAAFFFSLRSEAAVWSDVNQWDARWESAYSQWVQNNWQIDFFARPQLPNGQKNPYYGLRVDCADAVYSMRLIFAFENKLPFVVQDPTTVGKTISNKMSRWDDKNELEKVRRFLSFIYETMSTRSLPNDTYPVTISRSTIRPGTLIKTTVKNHHSWTVKEILPIGVPWLVFNSVVGAGSSLTLQQRQSWPNPEWVFEGDFSPAGTAGFRAFRQPNEINKPVWQVNGYSEEQYKIPLSKWVRTLQTKLATNQETDSQMIARLSRTACEALAARVPAVQEALDYNAKSGNRCMDYATYDNYSTPNRDQRLFDDLMTLRKAYKDILTSNGTSTLKFDQLKAMEKIFPYIQLSAAQETQKMQASSISENSLCPVTYRKGVSIDLAELKRRMFAGFISNNPHDDVSYRWGEVRGPSLKARSCQSWDPWSPDLTGGQ